MRDIESLNRTIRAIAEHGNGIATQRRSQFGFDWFAGRARLNNQCVDDLINDGWLKVSNKRATLTGYTAGNPAPRIREDNRT